eukprot:UN27821
MQTIDGLSFPPKNVTLKRAVRNHFFYRKTEKLNNLKDVLSQILICEKKESLERTGG